MIGVKEAVPPAIAFVKDLYPEAKDIRLEQVQPESSAWSVVLSFQTGEATTLASVMGASHRLYKTIQIDKENGEPLSLLVWDE